ncbi:MULTISPECIES: hypothetical protein [Streptomyces]|uniref:Uncharacterized protein n=1 Tax=Streptomyces virginiae TaxID=1961 RepID=A0ABZ1TP10_STRVG|nr:hypothetical protein [Streptomyces virginiae]WTB20129.1 hypothetical protein OG253_00560 [Streptomyces virginiae]
MTTADPEGAAREALARYLPIIDETAVRPFPPVDLDDGAGHGGPDHLVRVLRRSQDFWDDEYHAALHRAEEEMGAELDALAAALTVRWGDPLVVDLWSYLIADDDGKGTPEPIGYLCQNATEMRVWPLPGGGRWIGLTVGQHDTELPLELLAAVGRTPLPAPGAEGPGVPTVR